MTSFCHHHEAGDTLSGIPNHILLIPKPSTGVQSPAGAKGSTRYQLETGKPPHFQFMYFYCTKSNVKSTSAPPFPLAQQHHAARPQPHVPLPSDRDGHHLPCLLSQDECAALQLQQKYSGLASMGFQEPKVTSTAGSEKQKV